jgi:hypothetical protein
MEENKMTIKDLRDFLNKLPAEFNDFGVVNGEVGTLDGEFYYRVDKPVVQISVDEETKEFLILHQTQEEVDDIKNSVNDGPSKES